MTTTPRSVMAVLSTRVRIGLLALLLVGEGLVFIFAPDEEHAMDLTVGLLFLAAPFLAWFTIEPEPVSTPRHASTSWGRAARFPFQAGGSTGVAFFLLVFTLVVAMYVTWLRVLSGRGVWLADDDPIQLVMGTLYACVYVLLPVGLCAPFLHRRWARIVATAACVSSYTLLGMVFPAGPREPGRLTELGDPWLMIRTVLGWGELIHYARDDFAILAGLAALGVLLNAPRVIRRWRAG